MTKKFNSDNVSILPLPEEPKGVLALPTFISVEDQALLKDANLAVALSEKEGNEAIARLRLQYELNKVRQENVVLRLSVKYQIPDGGSINPDGSIVRPGVVQPSMIIQDTLETN